MDIFGLYIRCDLKCFVYLTVHKHSKIPLDYYCSTQHCCNLRMLSIEYPRATRARLVLLYLNWHMHLYCYCHQIAKVSATGNIYRLYICHIVRSANTIGSGTSALVADLVCVESVNIIQHTTEQANKKWYHLIVVSLVSVLNQVNR